MISSTLYVFLEAESESQVFKQNRVTETGRNAKICQKILFVLIYFFAYL